jgi:hypothetical protein
MERVKLANKTLEELNDMRLEIENDPKNRMPKGSFNLYTSATRKKLSDITWAITYKIARENGE